MRMEVRLFLTLLLFGLGSSVVPTEKVQSWMVLLKEFGKEKLQKINENNEKNLKKGEPSAQFSPINQYLVAAVISRNEFNNEVDEKYIQNLNKKTRLEFYVNKRRPNHGERKFHGEMIFLHEKGGLDDMVKLLQGEYGRKSEPLVLMYSYYIPCAHVGGLGYSCSEEIGKDSDSLRYPMYIAFTDVYNRTDEIQSKTYMAAGNDVQVFREIGQNQFNLQNVTYFTPVNRNQENTFQHLFNECLLNMGIGTCNTEQNRMKYVTIFVNTVVYRCTMDSRERGYITEYSRKPFLTCIDDFIARCNKCSKCSEPPYQNVKVAVQWCARSIVRPSLYLGKVEDIGDSRWQKWTGAWKDLTKPLNANGIPILPCRVTNDATLDNCRKKLVDLIKENQKNNYEKLYLTQKRRRNKK